MTDTAKVNTLLDELLKECQGPEEILGQQGLLKQLTKRLVERALAGELTAHLGYEPGEALALLTLSPTLFIRHLLHVGRVEYPLV
jgi:transposase-like protein